MSPRIALSPVSLVPQPQLNVVCGFLFTYTKKTWWIFISIFNLLNTLDLQTVLSCSWKLKNQEVLKEINLQKGRSVWLFIYKLHLTLWTSEFCKLFKIDLQQKLWISEVEELSFIWPLIKILEFQNDCDLKQYMNIVFLARTDYIYGNTCWFWSPHTDLSQ